MNHLQTIIQQKNGSIPFYSSGPTTITDTDHFPYQRFYRGQFNSDKPIVMDREAGWRAECKNNYTPIIEKIETFYPNHCFQSATSTVYPCMPEYQRKYSDKKEMDIQLFRTRINEYR